MSFQDNKFPILLGSITAVVAGGLIFWGMKSGGKFESAQEDFQTAKSDIERMSRASLPPTDSNRREKQKAVEEYAESIIELQTAFDPLRQPKLENIEPSAFTDALLEARKEVVDKFEKAGTTVPGNFFLGLGKYSDTLPPKGDTGALSFELKAFKHLLGKLAEAAPDQLNNVYWPGLPGDPGESATYIPHSLELTFTGSESSLREFLSSLDDSKEFFYVVRVMRVKNERSSAPNAKDATFEAPPAPKVNDPFAAGGFVFPPGDGVPAEEETPAPEGEGAPVEGEEAPAEPEPERTGPTDSGEILKQVLGSEKTVTFLRIDALQFLAPKELP